MRKLVLVGALCALATASSDLALAQSPGSGAAVGPSLALVSRHPFLVRGRNFKPAERVGVTLAYDGRPTRRARASPAGAFTADFGQVRIGRCDSFLVRAVGARGSIAVLKLPLPPACLSEGSTD